MLMLLGDLTCAVDVNAIGRPKIRKLIAMLRQLNVCAAKFLRTHAAAAAAALPAAAATYFQADL